MTGSLYSFPEIRVTVADRVALVELDRPEKRNAFTNRMKDSLVAAFAQLDQDDAVRVVLLTGAANAGKAFCAGADLSTGDFSEDDNVGSDNQAQVGRKHANLHRDGGGQAALAIYRCQKPVICAVNGHAVGIGITMTLPCDIRIAWEGAKIGFVFASRGIVPEATSSYFLPRLIGHSKALELFMTARVLPASNRSFEQLFSSLHPTPEATVAAGLALALEIAASGSALSHALTKALVWHGANSPEGQHLLDSRAMAVAGNSVDSKEGVKAFREKRAAKFSATLPRDLNEISEVYPWWVKSKL